MPSNYIPWRIAAQQWLETEVISGFRGMSLNGDAKLPTAGEVAYEGWAAKLRDRRPEIVEMSKQALAGVVAREGHPCHQALLESAAEAAIAMALHADLMRSAPDHLFPMLLVHFAKPYKPMAVYWGNRDNGMYEIMRNERSVRQSGAPLWGPEAKPADLTSSSFWIVSDYFGGSADSMSFEDALVPQLLIASPQGWSITKDDVGRFIEKR